MMAIYAYKCIVGEKLVRESGYGSFGLNEIYEKPNRRARKQTLRTSNSIDTGSRQQITSVAGTLGHIVFLGEGGKKEISVTKQKQLKDMTKSCTCPWLCLLCIRR